MNELLPIGSLVILENISKPVMILSYLPEHKGRVFDYLGVFYPVGLVSNKSAMIFNQSGIEKLIVKGYEDEDCRKFLPTIPLAVSEMIAEAEAKKGE